MTATTLPASRWPARLGWAIGALLCLGITGYASRYLLHPPTTAKEALGNPLGVPWLVIHVAGAVTALLLGSLQFLPGLRKIAVHRWVGRTYVLGCLVGGTAGLVLAPGSFAGPIASVGFGSLAVVWIAVNLLGWKAALAMTRVLRTRPVTDATGLGVTAYFLTGAAAGAAGLAAGAGPTAGFTAPFEVMLARTSVEKPWSSSAIFLLRDWSQL